MRKNLSSKNIRRSILCIWHGIKNRCFNPKCDAFKYYGMQDISLCIEWYSFENFYNWAIKTGYEKGLTIDRINHHANYSPENCQWLTRSENAKKSWKDRNGVRAGISCKTCIGDPDFWRNRVSTY